MSAASSARQKRRDPIGGLADRDDTVEVSVRPASTPSRMQHDKHLSPFPRLVAWKDGMALARNCGRNPRPDLWAFILAKEVYYNFIYFRLHVLASSGLGLAAPAAQAQGWACLADAHPNFTGISKGLAANGSSTRSDLNDKISSFKIVQGCRVIAYENVGFKGPNSVWPGNVSYVSDNWNNLISSWKCMCP